MYLFILIYFWRLNTVRLGWGKALLVVPEIFCDHFLPTPVSALCDRVQAPLILPPGPDRSRHFFKELWLFSVETHTEKPGFTLELCLLSPGVGASCPSSFPWDVSHRWLDGISLWGCAFKCLQVRNTWVVPGFFYYKY